MPCRRRCRRSCPTDGRVQHAQLTDKGVETLRRIWPVYRAGIAKYFGTHLDEAQAGRLREVFGRISAAAEKSGPGG